MSDFILTLLEFFGLAETDNLYLISVVSIIAFSMVLEFIGCIVSTLWDNARKMSRF